MENCPCGSSRALDQCCGPLLNGKMVAEQPEALMRSRYTAYSLHEFDYLMLTTDPQCRLDFDAEAMRKWMLTSTFTGLEVLRASAEGNKGVVEFRARYRVNNGPEQTHHEIARFRKQAGIWYFRPR